MKYLIMLVLIFLNISQNSYAISDELNTIILKNNEKPEVIAPRLWIHVCREDQEKVVQDANTWLVNLKLDGKTIDLQPTRVVTACLPKSKLRFFMKQDVVQAKKLLMELRKALPLLKLEDFSKEYEGIPWVTTGHYELWLAPNVNKLNIKP